MNQMLSLTEFASLINKSERQVRRYVEQGRLHLVETAAGPRISASELEAWQVDHRFGSVPNAATIQSSVVEQASPDTSETIVVLPEALSSAASKLASEAGVPVSVHLRTLDLLEAAHALAAHERQEKEKERLEKERERRRAEQLAMEIGAYQRALSETAESLAEQRALVIQGEAQRLAEQSSQTLVIDSQPEQLKLDLPKPSKGWGSRLKRMLRLLKTG